MYERIQFRDPLNYVSPLLPRGRATQRHVYLIKAGNSKCINAVD